MSKNRLYIGLAAVFILLAGFAYIIYNGRPVMHLAQENLAQETTSTATNSSENPTEVPSQAGEGTQTASTSDTYTLAQVQSHNSQQSCWSTIDGNVYDLTTWISRHPGGPQAIIGLCGTDGTMAFHQQHGTSRRQAAALALLKIGTLAL